MSATEHDKHNIKVNDTTLTKEEQDDYLRRLLPACQPQEGSPANTFTQSELDDLQRAVGRIKIGPPRSPDKNKTLSTEKYESSSTFTSNNKVDIRDVQQSFNPPTTTTTTRSPVKCDELYCPQAGDVCDNTTEYTDSSLEWHGAPRLHEEFRLAQAFREQVRMGNFTKPTNGVCPGFLQCNLVVLPQGSVAFDFLLFCQRNPKACPLIEVCDVGSPIPKGVAPGADLRTDVPKYVKYLHIFVNAFQLQYVVENCSIPFIYWLLIDPKLLFSSFPILIIVTTQQIFHLSQWETRRGSDGCDRLLAA
jgi:hypothetical protein